MKVSLKKTLLGSMIFALLSPFAVMPSASLPLDPLPAAYPEYVVGFHSFPSLRPGDLYQGAAIVFTDPVLRFAAVLTPDVDQLRVGALSDANVRYMEPSRQVRAFFTPNDPEYDQQYGPQHVQAPAAWDITLGSMMKNVCVVDTGVWHTHRDLEGRYLGGRDFYFSDDDPLDDNDHGTHVTGIAAAEINNGLVTAGMANVGILAAKVLGPGGYGEDWRVAAGIRWCADNGGDVINLSLGQNESSPVLQDAVAYAWAAGSLLVAAAGNQGPCEDCISYPAKYAEVIAVTCTDEDDAECSFSSDGPESELAAPGNYILSTIPGNGDKNYAKLRGTSMSSPHVAGAAALLWSRFPGLANCQVRSMLRATAHDLRSPGWDEQSGFGLVDAGALIDAAQAGDVPPLDCDVNGGPVCSIVGPTDDRIHGTVEFQVFSTNPNSTIQSVELLTNGVHLADLAADGPGGYVGRTKRASNGRAPANLTGDYVGSVDTVGFAEGSRRFDARCTDANGNSTTRGRSYLVDNLADPTVAILDPQEEDTLAVEHRILVAATSNVADPAMTVEVRVNSKPWRDITANRDADGNYYYNLDALRAAKRIAIRARSTDSAGHTVDVVTANVLTQCNNGWGSGWSSLVEECVCPRILQNRRCEVGDDSP